MKAVLFEFKVIVQRTVPPTTQEAAELRRALQKFLSAWDYPTYVHGERIIKSMKTTG
jgi:hypothetical protein